MLGGQGQVALVLAVLVVHHHHHAAGAYLGQGAGNVGEWGLEGAWGQRHSRPFILAYAGRKQQKRRPQAALL